MRRSEGGHHWELSNATSRRKHAKARDVPTRLSVTRSRSKGGNQASFPRLKSERTASALTGSKACIKAKDELVTARIA